MMKKYIIKYRAVIRLREEEVEATSKYNAKQVFYRRHPQYEIVSVTEKKEVSENVL